MPIMAELVATSNPIPEAGEGVGDGGPEGPEGHEPLELDETLQLASQERGLLVEILKCAVCLEIPRGVPSPQVRICEKGHHFCSACHKKLRTCAICRGRLFMGRNFVVEELITKLGPHLGIRQRIPPPAAPPPLTPGSYRCPHQCSASLPAGRMLPHIRKAHPCSLVDNLRSSPSNGRFDWIAEVACTADKAFTQSIQISDFGLVTIVAHFIYSDMFAWAQILGDDTTAGCYNYRLTARIENGAQPRSEFSISECPMVSYRTRREDLFKSRSYLRVAAADFSKFINPNDNFHLMFSMWKQGERSKDKDFEIMSLVPETPAILANDRKQRRNQARNLRKKELRRRLKEKGVKLHPRPPCLSADNSRSTDGHLVDLLNNLDLQLEMEEDPFVHNYVDAL